MLVANIVKFCITWHSNSSVWYDYLYNSSTRITYVYILAPDIGVDLSFYNPYDRQTAVYTFETNITVGVHLSVRNVPETVGFFIVQVHSHTVPLQLCNATNASVFVNGTNIGLVQMHHKIDDVYLFDIKSNSNNRMNIMIAITIYNREGK